MGVLGRIRESLSRTKQQIVERFDEIVRLADAPERRSQPIDVVTIEALEELLISADIGVAATDRILTSVKTRSRRGESLRDLVLTCTGTLSRNRRVGVELARGRRIADILAEMKMVAEGVRTTGAALALGARYGIELPIATQMGEVLGGRSDVRAAVEALMLRRQRAEAETG